MPVSARSSKDATDQSFLGSWFDINHKDRISWHYSEETYSQVSRQKPV